jgi:hypothetical protein
LRHLAALIATENLESDAHGWRGETKSASNIGGLWDLVERTSSDRTGQSKRKNLHRLCPGGAMAVHPAGGVCSRPQGHLVNFVCLKGMSRRGFDEGGPRVGGVRAIVLSVTLECD